MKRLAIFIIGALLSASAFATRIPSGTTDQGLYFVAVDATDFTTREPGLSGFTVYRERNNGTATAMTTPTVTEADATNMPGVYFLLLDEDMTIDTGDDEQEMVFHISVAGMAPVTQTIELFRPKMTLGNTMAVSSGSVGSSNVVLISGDAGAADALEVAYDGETGAVPVHGIARLGTAQSATGTTLVLDAAAPFADDTTIGMTLVACGATQTYCQSRVITDYVNSTDTATVEAWTVTPSGTITYYLFETAPGGAGGGLDAAGVRAAVGLNSANLDTQLSTIDTEVGVIDGIVDNILVDTAEIGAAGAGLTAINLPNQTMDITGDITGDLSGSVGSVTGNVGGTINGLTATAIADFFDTDSGTTYASAVAGSVVAETADNAGGSALTAAAIVDEWETQSQADPTGFHVNVLEVGGTAQTANDNGADINAILAWPAAWDTEVESEATDALNAYDPPTNAEMNSAFGAQENLSQAEAQAAAEAAIGALNQLVNCTVNTANFAGSTTTAACLLTDMDAMAITAASGDLEGKELLVSSGAQIYEARFITDSTWDGANSELQLTLSRALPDTLADAVTAIIR